jgi:hypothetical protein
LAAGISRAALAYHERPGGEVPEPLVPGGDENCDDADDVEGRKGVGEAKEVAHCRREEADPLSSVPDDPETRRQLADGPAGTA